MTGRTYALLRAPFGALSAVFSRTFPCAFLCALLCALLALPAPSAAAGQDDGEVVLGMSAAFSGPSRSLGMELYRGAMAYFADRNAHGGIFGRSWRIEARDDGYDPDRAVRNTIEFLTDDRVLLLFGYVGTPTTTRVLPLLKGFCKHGGLLFFPFSGAQSMREQPYLPFVFNLRDSYRAETQRIVDTCCALHRTRIAVFYQMDAYGRSGWDGVRRALEARGLSIAGEATYARGQGFSASMARQAALIAQARPDAVVSVGSYEASAAFVRDARAAGMDAPIFQLSFGGGESMLALLERAAGQDGRDYERGVFATQVVPSYEDASLEAVREYRAAMDSYAPPPPPCARGEGYAPLRYSLVSFEGFLDAKALDEMLRAVGRIPARGELAAAVAAAGDLDLGIGRALRYSPTDHQGLKDVYLTVARGGTFVPATPADIERWRQ
ncbi:extracellular ligand-binding receptor [Desulfovibrio sp. X2]|uniref:ABC transporter substrate-binding protein n=1 Tax=Desulfovibrio sp. X2 TaxID=941449 RepID=UPI0003589B6A|nr:ABC transporter substrate-binding protein [Desulfovibrio sp. X2]EPR41920.1 extracellular ligand-binding receptor [Desulfovibrio sp. X2]